MIAADTKSVSGYSQRTVIRVSVIRVSEPVRYTD